ncbi:hypothetical protein EV702DRAFT_1197118 [Suillus placidus]|uniref:Uncharacterized protein n=1 Tax=Suillus placidus TaxID=48579 RepID=A0A9P7D397_9AGAM|nr:hypothetical protein EV702DRAFT_1197118 [Suillus placidus]
MSRLDYLDLEVKIPIHFIEIKLTAEFDFDQHDGILSIFPSIRSALLASEPIEDDAEQHILNHMHSLFADSFACMVHRRKFRWDRVQLPAAMLKRIAALDEVEHRRSPIPDSPLPTVVSKQLMDTNISDSYIFPDPLPPAVVLPQLADEYAMEDWRSSTNSIDISSESSLSCSTIISPYSTRSSLHSLSEDDAQERALLSQPLLRVPTQTRPLRRTRHSRRQIQASATSQSTWTMMSSSVAPSQSIQTVMSPSTTSLQPIDTMTSSSVSLPQPAPHPFLVSPLSPPLKFKPISPTTPTSMPKKSKTISPTTPTSTPNKLSLMGNRSSVASQSSASSSAIKTHGTHKPDSSGVKSNRHKEAVNRINPVQLRQ